MSTFRNSRPEVFCKKDVVKICSKFKGEHPYQNAISIKLQSNFIEITIRHGCSPVNLPHLLRTPFPKNSSGWLLVASVLSKIMFQEAVISANYLLAGNYMFKVNNRNTRRRCEICSKLIIKTPEQRHWRLSCVFIVDFEHISHLVVFLLLILSR